jgi:phosphoglycolate phosphatase
MRYERPDAILFDMDGTLFKTETLIVPAYERAFERLKQEGLFQGPTPPATRILGALGLLLQEIWDQVIPGAAEATKLRINNLLLEEQLILLSDGHGELYPDVESTLQNLRDAGYRLFVASNGLESYVKGVAYHQGIDAYFDGIYSAGEYGTKTKVDLVRLLLDHHNVRSAWMVGDRSSDVEAGRENNLTVVGCTYAGFGVATDELQGAHYQINAFEQLQDLLRNKGTF